MLDKEVRNGIGTSRKKKTLFQAPWGAKKRVLLGRKHENVKEDEINFRTQKDPRENRKRDCRLRYFGHVLFAICERYYKMGCTYEAGKSKSVTHNSWLGFLSSPNILSKSNTQYKPGMNRSGSKPAWCIFLMDHSRPLFIFIFVLSIKLTVNIQYNFLPLTGFEPRTSGVRSERSTN